MKNRVCFLLSVIFLLMISGKVLAQDYDYHPMLSDNLVLWLGAYWSDKSFKLSAEGVIEDAGEDGERLPRHEYAFARVHHDSAGVSTTGCKCRNLRSVQDLKGSSVKGDFTARAGDGEIGGRKDAREEALGTGAGKCDRICDDRHRTGVGGTVG